MNKIHLQNLGEDVTLKLDTIANDGLSAYEIAVSNGYIGTEDEWLISLKGEKGDRGIQGLKGETGAQGLPGIQGLKGDKGDRGDQGIQGIQGETGAQGIQGERGLQGEQGIQGEKGEQGIQGIQGVQGIKGDMGDGFTITKSYKTIIEMNNAFATDGVAVGAFVIISSDEPDTDPDNSKVFVKTETEYRFQSVLRGLKGEKGDQGIQGIQGIQGEKGDRGIQGIQGVQGVRGLQGRGVVLKGTVLDEPALADIALTKNPQVGDAYWTEDGILWIWTDNPALVVEPTFLRSPSLIGKQGLKGDTGERGQDGLQGAKGDQGERGESFELKGTLLSEVELPPTALIGDTYWVGTKLYTWTKNPKEGVAEGFLASPDLKGQQGIRGEKGEKGGVGQGVTDLGTATLLTQAQTIKEAINEVFQRNNSNKKSLVDELLLLDPSLPISQASTWEQIVNAIKNIDSGGTSIIGNKTSLATYEDNLQAGEFIKYQQKFSGTDYFQGSSVNFNFHVRSSNTKVLGDKILVGREKGTELPFLNLLEYKNDRVSLLQELQFNASTRGGNNFNVCALNRNKAIAVYNGGGTGTNFNVYARVILIGEDYKLSMPVLGTEVSTIANSGFGTGVLRVTDDSFIVFYRTATNGCEAKTYRVNTNNSLTQVVNSQISPDVGNSFEPIYLNAERTKILVLGLKSNSNNELTGTIVTINPTTLTIEPSGLTITLDSGLESGVGANAFITNETADKVEVSIFHNESSNGSIRLTVIEIKKSDYTIDVFTKRTQNVIKVSGSGIRTSDSSRLTNKMHSEKYMGNGIFLVLYKNNTITEHVYIDTKQEVIVPYGATNLRADSAGTNDLMLIDFGNRNYGALIQGASNAQGLVTIVPETNLRKATSADCVSGVTTASGSFPKQIDITVPQ